MVKTLHSIAEIAANGALDSVRLVRLEHAPGETAAELPTVDPAAATFDALATPLGYPPLSAAIVPGDCVAIAVDEGVPCLGEIVSGVVKSLRNSGVEDEAISVVARSATTSQVCREALSSGGEAAVQFVVHDPEDERELCMVGMTKRHGPLVINRTIFDADVVLPVGWARLDDRSVFGSLFPGFSSSEAIARFRAPARRDSPAAMAKLERESDEAGWLIGAVMIVEVVPARDATVAQVVAGEPAAVAERVQQLCREHWEYSCPQRASLVIATVTGGPLSQTWSNVGRALANAQRLVAEDGAIAICSNLEQPPGESLGRLVAAGDLEAAERRIFRDHAADSWPAWLLARALQGGPVYFLSQLDSETVEDMGLAPVTDVSELMRLARRHESVVVLPDAQHAVVTVIGENNE